MEDKTAEREIICRKVGRGMTRDETKRIIGLLIAAYPSRKIEDVSALVDSYWLGLDDCDYPAVELACKSLIRSSKFFPSISELRDIIAQSQKYTAKRYAPLALRGEAVRLYETDAPDWLGLAGRMRINGQECAAVALELRASGAYADGLSVMAEICK